MPADAAVARRGRRDAGDETSRNFRYQHSYGVILLTAASRGELPYAAIWCEMHEDILAERLDGRFEAWQIKTRKPENGAWTNMDRDFLDALARFAPLDQALGERVDRFHFVSNAAFAEARTDADARRLMRSPLALLDHVRRLASNEKPSPPFDDLVLKMSERCGMMGANMVSLLRRVDLVVGPSRNEIDAALSNEHLARVAAHSGRSAAELDEVRDDLVAAVARASSLHVTDPARHTRSLVNGTRDPTALAKRIAVAVVSDARPRLSPRIDIPGLHLRLDEIVAKIDQANAGGLTRVQVEALLQAFSDADYTGTDAMELLLAKAGQLRSLQDGIARQVADGPAGSGLEPVLEAMRAGDYDRADEELEGFAAAEATSRNSALFETVRLYALRASLAAARLRMREAAMHFGTAATIAAVFDKARAFDLAGAQQQALLEHAVMRGGSEAFDEAISIGNRRIETAPPGSAERFEATWQIVSVLGIFSERAPATEARRLIEVAVRLGRAALADLDPERHEDLWLPTASNLGAALNNAARLAETEESAAALTHEALDVLEHAASIVTPDHPEASNVEANLATALRRSAAVSEAPRPALERAIASRLRALRDEESLSQQHRGNAHDSLGNDYSSLAASGLRLDKKTFRLGLASYRRALRHRPKASSPIDWARTQSNIAAHHGRACQLSMGGVAERHGRAALARIDMAMSVLDRDNAPHDWSHGCRHMAATALLLLEAGFDPGTDRLRSVLSRLGDAAELADTYLDGDTIVQTLELQAAVAAHLFERRDDAAVTLIGAARERLQSRLRIYQQSPFNLLFQLADAQFRFIVAYLASDRPEAEQAIAWVRACAAEPAAATQTHLVNHAREIALEMEKTLAGMPLAKTDGPLSK